MAKFIALDVESGGTDPKTTSLLTASFMVLDDKYFMLDELNLLLKPNDGIYRAKMSAMEVNRIDLTEHDKKAMTYSEGGAKLRDFLYKHSGGGQDKLIPLGKNVNFDIGYINEQLLNSNTWNQFVSYRFYDLTSIIMFAKRIGLLNPNAPEGLQKLAAHLDLQFDTRAHDARSDVMMTIDIIKGFEEAAKY
jgi:hypothetical protein